MLYAPEQSQAGWKAGARREAIETFHMGKMVGSVDRYSLFVIVLNYGIFLSFST